MTADDDNEIEELANQIKNLSIDEHNELLEIVYIDRFEDYRENNLGKWAREDFFDVLGDEESVGLFGPYSQMEKHCREHPDDPICWVVQQIRLVNELQQITAMRGFQFEKEDPFAPLRRALRSEMEEAIREMSSTGPESARDLADIIRLMASADPQAFGAVDPVPFRFR